ncbi:MAG TPA: choice-of-anchor tandem repeat GloVer-containing protein [Rhizomicrobium sp.]
MIAGCRAAIWRNALVSLLGLAGLVASGAIPQAQAQTYSVLHRFRGHPDGFGPNGVFRDAAGNLFGTGIFGGAYDNGTVFELDTAGTLSVVHSFKGFPSTDGSFPAAGVVGDDAGNLYGTTTFGGKDPSEGTLYKLDQTGKLTILYSFCRKQGCTDGEYPASIPVLDPAGNLYGTAMSGGNCSQVGGCGVVFELSSAARYKVLHTFTGGADGATPAPGGGLVRDSQGNLYGTVIAGGDLNCSYLGSSGCGTLFKIDAAGAFSVVHTFEGPDGTSPAPGLVFDAAGNLYGATNGGGTPAKKCFLAGGCGVVFKMTPAGDETVLHSFCSSKSCDEGALPQTGVAVDSAGVVYGTTEFGTHQTDWGTVFRLDAAGLTVLHNYAGGKDGATPQGSPVLDADGNLYGATYEGGNISRRCQFGCGVLFKVAPAAP